MTVIYKYELDLWQSFTVIPVPEGKSIYPLHVAFQPDGAFGQREIAQVWCSVVDDNDAKESELRLAAVPTGREFPDGGQYVGTAISSNGSVVMHVYQVD